MYEKLIPLLAALPPPDELRAIVAISRNSLFVFRSGKYGVAIDTGLSHFQELRLKPIVVPYYENQLTIALVDWQKLVDNVPLLVRKLQPANAQLGLIH